MNALLWEGHAKAYPERYSTEPFGYTYVHRSFGLLEIFYSTVKYSTVQEVDLCKAHVGQLARPDGPLLTMGHGPCPIVRNGPVVESILDGVCQNPSAPN